jgi:hypothetical protein
VLLLKRSLQLRQSVLELRNWLEHERQALEQAGDRIPRPPISDGAAPETISERQQKTAALAEGLMRGVSADPGRWKHRQRRLL